jgi:hypothetical protein
MRTAVNEPYILLIWAPQRRRNSMAYGVSMKRIAVVVPIVFCSLGGPSAWAIDCMSAPGSPKDGWYAWREIDGRKCWFKKTGAMPPKSQLHWPAKAERETAAVEPSPAQRTIPAAARPQEATPVAARPQEPEPPKAQSKPAPVAHFTTLPVRPSSAPLRLGNGQIDLMSSATLSGAQPLGKQKSPGFAPADPFGARFSGKGD